MQEDRSDGGVRSVQLALDVLETLAFSNEELGVTQLAQRLKLTKGSVHRHLLTLVERGYLVQNPITTRYALGPRSRLLAHYAPDADLIQLAAGPMRELRDQLGHSVVLSEVNAARCACSQHGAGLCRDRDRCSVRQRAAVPFVRTGQNSAGVRAAPATTAPSCQAVAILYAAYGG